MLRDTVADARTRVWAWCLMPTHLHMILVPSHEDGLRQTMARLNRRYASRMNLRHGWSGHFWQGRYSSVVMDEAHLLCGFRYVLLNPVLAKLVDQPWQWRWSSARTVIGDGNDHLTERAHLRGLVGDVDRFLSTPTVDGEFEPLRMAEVTGRPVGGRLFLEDLERRLQRVLRPQRRGRKANQQQRHGR